MDYDAEARVFSIPSERSTSAQSQRDRYRRRYGQVKATCNLVGGNGVCNTNQLGVKMGENSNQNSVLAPGMQVTRGTSSCTEYMNNEWLTQLTEEEQSTFHWRAYE